MDDNQYTSNKLKLTPHMFRKSSQDPIDIEINQDNLAKIFRSYRTNKESEKENSNFYVECLNNLVNLQNIDETESFYQYLTELRSKYIKEKDVKEKIIEENIPETIENIEVEESIEIETFEEPIEGPSESIDITHIIKSTEQEIASIKDQKTLLKSLIEDVNANSTKIQYDDAQFERNITEIINDTESTEHDDDDIEDNNTENITLTNKKKSNIILIIVIIILLIVAGYLYRETIFEIFK